MIVLKLSKLYLRPNWLQRRKLVFTAKVVKVCCILNPLYIAYIKYRVWILNIFTDDKKWNSSLAAEFRNAAAASSNRRPLFWTSESDPGKHTSRHEGFFYTISPDHFSRWLTKGQGEHINKVVVLSLSMDYIYSCVCISSLLSKLTFVPASNLQFR